MLPKTLAAASVRLCVETCVSVSLLVLYLQPPPCGCVLKPYNHNQYNADNLAAASVRLCVETMFHALERLKLLAAASVRLCVETVKLTNPFTYSRQPPPCGCVLKPIHAWRPLNRLWQPPPCGCVLKPFNACVILALLWAAASVRLCVETPAG